MELVLLATAWGPKAGGINAFNQDFAMALGRLLGPGRVTCVVLEASMQDRQAAAENNVTLLDAGKNQDSNRFEEFRADDVLRLLQQQDIKPRCETVWIGHDIHTGELSNRIAEISQLGMSVVIQHMSYRDYISYRDGVGKNAKHKSDRQVSAFHAADCVFAVGPLLRKRLSGIVSERGKTANMIVPGLASISPSQHHPGLYRAVTLGRLGPNDDRIKQGRLAIAAIATACRAAHENPMLPSPLRDVEMLLYGINESGGEEEKALRLFAQEQANRVINMISLPFSEDRQSLFGELRQCSVAMMLSWHEGFGLSGWEAIAAGVPLIASRNSGLYELIRETLGDTGLVLMKPVDIRGKDDPAGDINFHQNDVKTARAALLDLAKDTDYAKSNALKLRHHLLAKDLTWDNAALRFIDDLHRCPAFGKRNGAKSQPIWDINKQGPPYLGLQAMTEKHADVFFGREVQLRELAEKLSGQPFVAIVGASGVGKSSLVWAGLLPKLNAWQVSGFSHWVWLRMTPGQSNKHSPIEVLAAIIARRFDLLSFEVEQALLDGGRGLEDLLKTIYKTGSILNTKSSWQLLLFIDQFEELFSLVTPKFRKPFIDALENLIATQKARVLTTMRADFLGQCMQSEDFGERLAAWFNNGQYLLASPGNEALLTIAREPAERAGLLFETGLVQQIVADTGLKPGNLALMAFALEQLYQRRKGRVMKWEAYKDFGGIEGAIADKAEAIFQAALDAGMLLTDIMPTQPLGNEQTPFPSGSAEISTTSLLGNIFRELVEIDEHNGEATRKRAAMHLWGLDSDDSRLSPTLNPTQRLILDFIKARLLLTDCEVRFGQECEPTLEVAHEALFRKWPILANWINERKNQFVMRKRLQRDAMEWEGRGKPGTFHWPDALALEAGEMIRALPYDRITEIERRFLGPVHKEDMLQLIHRIDTPHTARATIGVRLALLGDDRPGVGVKNGLPDIVWCEVPAGQVELEKHAGSFEVATFHIAKYPITQTQYYLFIDAADGYRNKEWWEGMPDRFKDYREPGRQVPGYGNHPAINVAWVDAMAYSRWLSRKLGKDVRLPTEWEWQQAASNNCADNIYPWGSEWDKQRCNSYESELNYTIAVGLYAQDYPEYRPLDMSGNVWEWCLNEFANPVPYSKIALDNENERTIRGGSWDVSSDYVRCADRGRYRPLVRYGDLGFRLISVSL